VVTGPGLAKARSLPLIVARAALLLRVPDPVWQVLFERADTVSEGGIRDEAQGRVWYGSTSIILPAQPAEASVLSALAARDLHVRLRAMRAACLEARSRAPSRLGRVTCEIRVAADQRGVRVDVDVQAPLIEGYENRKAAP
jgi:hypothetical protein